MNMDMELKEDWSKAFEYSERVHKLKGADGTGNLADCYRIGNGVKKDARKAFELSEEKLKFCEDALQEDPTICNDGGTHFGLSGMYYEGEGFERNYPLTADCLTQSLQFNDSEGMRRLGKMYLEGLKVKALSKSRPYYDCDCQ